MSDYGILSLNIQQWLQNKKMTIFMPLVFPFLMETQTWTKQPGRKPAISAEEGWDEKQKTEKRQQNLVDRLRLKESCDDEWIKSKQWAQIYLEFEIEIAARTLSNPVCLHGFDPVPLRKVCQSIQQRLEEEDENKDTSLLLFQVFKRALFTVEKSMYILQVGNQFLIIIWLPKVLENNAIESNPVCIF